MLTVNNTGGFYYNNFFTPPGDNNFFNHIGNPQLGVELLGHSPNDDTRYSVAVVTGSNGSPNLRRINRTMCTLISTNRFKCRGSDESRSVLTATSVSPQPAFKLGVEIASLVPGQGNRSFYRAGAYAHWYPTPNNNRE